MKFFIDFINGIRYFITGIIFFLTHPILWIYSIISGFISYCSYNFISTFVIDKLKPMMLSTFSINGDSFIASIIKYIIDGFICISLAALSISLFLIINFLSTPAQRALSKRTEKVLTGDFGIVENNKNFILRFISGVFEKLHETFDLIKMFILAIAVNIIPIVGQILCIFIISYHFAYTYFEFTFDRKDIEYSQRKKIMKQHRGCAVGFGLMCILFLIMPHIIDMNININTRIFNLSMFAVPINIIGGTVLCVKKFSNCNYDPE